MDLPSIVVPKCFHSCGIPTASAIQRSAFHAATCNSRWVGRYSGLRPSVYRPTESNRRLAALLSEPSFSPMSYRLKDTQYCVSAILQRRHLLQLCPGFHHPGYHSPLSRKNCHSWREAVNLPYYSQLFCQPAVAWPYPSPRASKRSSQIGRAHV